MRSRVGRARRDRRAEQHDDRRVAEAEPEAYQSCRPPRLRAIDTSDARSLPVDSRVDAVDAKPLAMGYVPRRVRAADSLRATLSMAAMWSQSTPCLNPKPSASKPGPTSAGYVLPSASSIKSKTPSVSATPSNAARATAWFCAAPSGANCLSSRASMTDVGEFASFLLAGCGGVLCAAAVHRCGCCGRHSSFCD